MIRRPPRSTLFPTRRSSDLEHHRAQHDERHEREPEEDPARVTAEAEPERGALIVHEAQLHVRSEEHTSELQSQSNLVCRLLLEKKKKKIAVAGRAREATIAT